ncbi:MAG: anti-toxin [Hyphomicrobiales bacterium]|nr:MAG: anti-toxin [Hyphomicrobiales bacterium]
MAAMAYFWAMSTLSIEIDGELQSRWEELAKKHGLDPQQQITDAIIDRLEELEDYYLVKDRLSGPYETIPHEEVLRRLGLSDHADES